MRSLYALLLCQSQIDWWTSYLPPFEYKLERKSRRSPTNENFDRTIL